MELKRRRSEKGIRLFVASEAEKPNQPAPGNSMRRQFTRTRPPLRAPPEF